MPNYGHVVIYKNGKRIDKRVHKSKLRDAADRVKQLKAQGVKAHLVWRTDSGTYPPPREIKPMRDLGQLWCPYCRAWRWFAVPKFTPGAPVCSPEWYMNSYHRQSLKVCKWCTISMLDFWVCKANGTFGEVYGAKRSRKKRRSR